MPDKTDPDSAGETIRAAISELDAAHRASSENTQQIGYILERLKATQPFWDQIERAEPDESTLAEMISRGREIAQLTRARARRLRERAEHLEVESQDLAGTADFFVTATGTTASFATYGPTPIGDLQEAIPVLWEPDRHQRYARKLGQLDPALANVYRQIWQSKFGTTADPDRPALFLMRQAFDHFFDCLAPKHEVAAWLTDESGEQQPEVTRRDRLTYAAYRWIPDPGKREELLALDRHIIATYKALNRAHERGDLRPEAAERALLEMQSYLERWADAISH